MTARCPECDAVVPLDAGVVVGEVVSCPDCAAELEVRALQPPELVLAPPEEEDWGE
jgi:alpha-aminoadipate carrier protein LysW